MSSEPMCESSVVIVPLPAERNCFMFFSSFISLSFILLSTLSLIFQMCPVKEYWYQGIIMDESSSCTLYPSATPCLNQTISSTGKDMSDMDNLFLLATCVQQKLLSGILFSGHCLVIKFSVTLYLCILEQARYHWNQSPILYLRSD